MLIQAARASQIRDSAADNTGRQFAWLYGGASERDDPTFRRTPYRYHQSRNTRLAAERGAERGFSFESIRARSSSRSGLSSPPPAIPASDCGAR